MAKVALITGGNGITGSAITECLVETTSKEEWSEIIVTSRSPFQTTVQDPRIRFIALDFSKEAQTLVPAMREVCASVTHAYFSSYVHRDDFSELDAANKSLFETFLTALVEVAPKLENCTLQTGGKYYNVHLEPVPSPASEDDLRRGHYEDNFYFPQEDFLSKQQRNRPWTWNVVRPTGIIGHTLKPNGMNHAITFALYLLICKELGEEARMPTNQLYWDKVEDCSDAGLIAAFTVWVSTTPSCGNQAFNIVNGDTYTWREMWPRIATYLGAKATSEQTFTKAVPNEGEVQQEFSLVEWHKDKRPVWEAICDKAGMPEAKATFDAGTWQLLDWVWRRTWSGILSMDKAKAYGWTGYKDSYDSITESFERSRALKQIP